MTYGPIAEDLRHTLAQVMNDSEPERSLPAAVGAAEDDPDSLVALVDRYRGAIIRAMAELPREGSSTGRALTARLTDLGRTFPRPSMDELAQPHPFALVDGWRRAAVAAATLAERELPAIQVSAPAVRMVLQRDAAQVAVALVRLDARYAHVKGWRTITNRLGWAGGHGLAGAAELARGWPQRQPTGLAEGLVVDQLGYDDGRRAPREQSQVSAVVRDIYAANDALQGMQPGITMLRSIAKGQEAISGTLSKQAWANGMLSNAEGFIQRAGAYRMIVEHLANIRSGANPDDVAAASIARGHILVAATTLPHVTRATASELQSLALALHEADQILSNTISEGLRTGWFFETWEQVGWYSKGLVKVPKDRWEVMQPAGHPELTKELGRLATLLHEKHYALAPEPASANDRAWFAAEIERTTIPVPSNSAHLPAGHPREPLRSVLASHHDGAPAPVRLVHARELGPAYAALVETGTLRVVREGVAVPAAIPITPTVRAASLVDQVPVGVVAAGRTAAWVHTGLRPAGILQLAAIARRNRPSSSPVRDVWETRPGTDAVAKMGGVLVTTPMQTAIEVAVRLPKPEAHRILLALASDGLDLTATSRHMEMMLRLQGRPRARAVLAEATKAAKATEPVVVAKAAKAVDARRNASAAYPGAGVHLRGPGNAALSGNHAER